MLLGLLFLSRLDTIFFVGTAILSLWIRDRDSRIVRTIAVSAAVGATYVAFNLLEFGHAVPISGAIKSGFSHQIFFRGHLGAYGCVALCGSVGLSMLALLRRSRSRLWRFAMMTLGAGVFLQCLYVLTATVGATTWVWYYVQGFLCVGLVGAELVEIIPGSKRIPIGGVALVLALVASAAVAGAKYWTTWSWHDRRMHADPWRESWLSDIRQVMSDPNAVIVTFDQPGLFAYSTNHPIFALDGLTSDFGVDSEIASKGMYAVLASYPHAYFMAPVVNPGKTLHTAMMTQTGTADGQIIHFTTPHAGKDAGCMMLYQRGLLVSRPVPPTLAGDAWGLWDLTRSTARAIACPE
jgi:hypothetical protein